MFNAHQLTITSIHHGMRSGEDIQNCYAQYDYLRPAGQFIAYPCGEWHGQNLDGDGPSSLEIVPRTISGMSGGPDSQQQDETDLTDETHGEQHQMQDDKRIEPSIVPRTIDGTASAQRVDEPSPSR